MAILRINKDTDRLNLVLYGCGCPDCTEEMSYALRALADRTAQDPLEPGRVH